MRIGANLRLRLEKTGVKMDRTGVELGRNRDGIGQEPYDFESYETNVA